MIAIAIITILILLVCYSELGFLTNIGFTSKWDEILRRAPFRESPDLREDLNKMGIKDGLFGELSGQNGKAFRYSPYWVSINRWLMMGILVIIALLILNRILVKKKVLPEYIADIPVYASGILLIVGYYATAVIFGKYEITMENGSHGGFILAVVFMTFAIIFAIIRYRLTAKAERRFEDYKAAEAGKTEDEIRLERKFANAMAAIAIVMELVGIVFICFMWRDSYKICKDYESNYGCYFEEEHELRTDLEDTFNGNFMNQAVETEDGIYYIDDVFLEGDDVESWRRQSWYGKSVKKMDKNGEISTVYEGDYYYSEKVTPRHSEFYTISYADGYLYLSRNEEIVRMDPTDGSMESVITASEEYDIADACIIDNRLYYEEYVRDDAEDKSLPTRVFIADISGKDISEPRLYLSDVNTTTSSFGNNYRSDLLMIYITGEPIKYSSTSSRDQYVNGECYNLAMDHGSNRDGDDHPRLVSRAFSEDEKYMKEQVAGYTIYDNAIYYVQLKEDGVDLCKCSLDGTNVEVLNTYNAGRDCRGCSIYNYQIIIGQGKILVNGMGYLFPEFNEDGEYLCMDSGIIRFVTDFK